jgi:hypothetical protein
MPLTSRSHLSPLATRLALPLLLAAVACAPSENDGTSDAEAAPDAAETSDAAEPAAGEAWLGEVRVGGAVDPQGAVPADRETARFAAGDSIYASMAIDGAPANAAVYAVFYDGSGDKIAEDEKKVPADARYLYFDAGDTSNWLPGEYRVEMSIDGRVHSTEEIVVGEAAPESSEDEGDDAASD